MATKQLGPRLRLAARWLLALAFIAAGLAHFFAIDFYVAIMPSYLPWHVELVLISGVFEVAGGVAILIPKLRRLAGWGLVLLLIAVFPANIHLAMHPPPGMEVGIWGWVRLPFQLLFIAWVLWVARPDEEAASDASAAMEPAADQG